MKQRKNMVIRSGLIAIFIFFGLFLELPALHAQNIKLQGKVFNVSGNPLVYANVFAYPQNDAPIVYAITDKTGHYKLSLLKGQAYAITVSYLGYKSQTFKLSLTAGIEKDITLDKKTETLEAVELSYVPPVIVKKDTTVYRVSAFTSGNERKLRDVLEKLPAVEVDRDGNVTVKGKRVTKVLVEDKTFFTGGTQLAVNNIPADALDKIQILEDYHNVAFLKGLDKSGEVAMNIVLKEDKKKFVFGDIEAGVGPEKRYLIHPALYYYSPKTSVNFIGDLNNTGQKSFTLKDYMNFEGGRNKLMRNAQSYFSLFGSELVQFIQNRSFTTNRNQFGALSLSQSIGEFTELSGYGIFANTKNKTQYRTINQYISQSDSLDVIENRLNLGDKESLFGIGKIKFEYKPNYYTDFTSITNLKFSNNRAHTEISTVANENRNLIHKAVLADNVVLTQTFNWHKQFNENRTSSALFTYRYKKMAPKSHWFTNKTILQGLIPIIEQDVYTIFKNKGYKTRQSDLLLKHYWVLNRSNHIYVTSGFQLAQDDYKTREFQELEDGSINDFSSFNFGNDSNVNFSDVFLGIQYKSQVGQFIVKPGLFYHNYNWKIFQFDSSSTYHKITLLPEFTLDFTISDSKKINFRYARKSRFPTINQFANRYTLLNFNQVYQGRQDLENALYHQFRLSYYNFNFFNKLFYNFAISYELNEKTISNSTEVKGMDFVLTPVYVDFKNRHLSFYSNIQKGFGDFEFSLKAQFSSAKYELPINTQIVPNSSYKYMFKGGVETSFKKLPNIELTYELSYKTFKGATRDSYQTNVFSAYVDYNLLKNFLFKLDYRLEKYGNIDLKNNKVFDLANLSLFYQRRSSPWRIGVSVNNLFKAAYRVRNSLSSLLISSQRTYIMPRVILLELSYKL